MLIDWFTVAAQTLNFLILVALLKRFLYQPIIDAIDAREQHIAKALAKAAKIKHEAEQARDEFNTKNTDFDQQRNNLLADAKNAAATEQQRLMELARAQAEAFTAKRHAALKREQQDLSDDLSRLTRIEVFAITRKTLTELANYPLEKSMVDVFIARLATLNTAAKTTLVDAIAKSEKVNISSAFVLQEPERTTLQQAINESFSAAVPLQFLESEALIAGIELTASGQKLAWTIESYLADLEQGVTDLLSHKITSPKSPLVATS